MFKVLEQFELSNAIISDACIVNQMALIANQAKVFELKNCQINISPERAQLFFDALSTNNNLSRLCIENCDQNENINSLVTSILQNTRKLEHLNLRHLKIEFSQLCELIKVAAESP